MSTKPRSTSPAADADIAPVVKSIVVPWPPAEAFRRFTDGIGEWWPLSTHSIGQSESVKCAFEPRPGGRLFETTRDGTEHEWGTVTDWDPPHRLALEWYPGRPADSGQPVEITFRPEPAGGTRVRLVHAGWERLGPEVAGTRADYDTGWDLVLERYAG